LFISNAVFLRGFLLLEVDLVSFYDLDRKFKREKRFPDTFCYLRKTSSLGFLIG
jgi:hypothetical protein